MFRVFAAGHPGEYVAIVLDGVVLATLPVEGTTAKGRFSFTGDYTVPTPLGSPSPSTATPSRSSFDPTATRIPRADGARRAFPRRGRGVRAVGC